MRRIPPVIPPTFVRNREQEPPDARAPFGLFYSATATVAAIPEEGTSIPSIQKRSQTNYQIQTCPNKGSKRNKTPRSRANTDAYRSFYTVPYLASPPAPLCCPMSLTLDNYDASFLDALEFHDNEVDDMEGKELRDDAGAALF